MSYPKFRAVKRFSLRPGDVIGGAQCWQDDDGWHYDGNSGGAPKSAQPIRDVCSRGPITPQWALKLYTLWCNGDAEKKCHLSYELFGLHDELCGLRKGHNCNCASAAFFKLKVCECKGCTGKEASCTSAAE